MKIITALAFCLAATTAFAQVDTSQQINPNTKNAKQQQDKPYVILISADGFRYDYAEKYQATHLLALSKGGVAATSMLPSYPSITFPNHYSIVTGLYPAHHGLVANAFYDPKLNKSYSYKNATAVKDAAWYGGTPIWTLAEQQKMLSAGFYWVGSETAEQGIFPTYYYHYNEKINIHDRIAIVKNWLSLPADRRPHLIAMYFPEVDHVGHKKGPDAPETGQAVRFIDSAVYELTKAVQSTGIKANFVFVSDHGMTGIPLEKGIDLPTFIDTANYRIFNEGVFVNLYAKNKSDADLNALYKKLSTDAKDYSVYLKNNVPGSLHYGAADDWHGHIGDLVLIPKYPHVFYPKSRKFDFGIHGFNPDEVKDMHAIFMAWGPNFRNGLIIAPFRNVNVYPVLTQILGLKSTDKIDGTDDVAKNIVK